MVKGPIAKAYNSPLTHTEMFLSPRHAHELLATLKYHSSMKKVLTIGLK